MEMKLKRCWVTDHPLHIKYHDEEWGVPLHDEKKFFEFLVLGGFQAGLTWWLILERREAFRKAFDDFDPRKVADYTAADILRIMNRQGIIRNEAKISSAINNARVFLDIQREFGSFSNFIWQFVQEKAINNTFLKLADLPVETEESKIMSSELKKKGFKFVGPTICYAFMQATGLVNDHLVSCFRYDQIRRMK
jgi:DNA-3-methyladenine glycosylase I